MAAIILMDLIHRRKYKNKNNLKSKLKAAAEMVTKTESEEYLNTCRICLGNGEIAIFTECPDEDITKDIKLFTGIEIIQEDEFPKFLCSNCYNLLQSAILFRRLALKTDDKLKKAKRKLRKRKKRIKYAEEAVNDFENPETTTAKEEENVIEEVDMETIDNGTSWQEIDEISEPEKYYCKKCDLEFADSKEYATHLKTPEHKARKGKPVVKRTTCTICHTNMVAAYLETHMIRKHSTLKPFVCEVCGKSFPAQSGLRQHSRIHSNELPFKCQECPYRGRFSHSLRLHMRVHTGEKPYSCHICSTQFSFQTNFNKHMKSHKTDYDFKCNQCDRGFHSQKQMSEHIRIDHTGLKEHRCHICGKEFAYRKLMTKHTRVVHKIKKNPYKGRVPLYIQMEKEVIQDKENLDG